MATEQIASPESNSRAGGDKNKKHLGRFWPKCLFFWWALSESNRAPTDYESSSLTSYPSACELRKFVVFLAVPSFSAVLTAFSLPWHLPHFTLYTPDFPVSPGAYRVPGRVPDLLPGA